MYKSVFVVLMDDKPTQFFATHYYQYLTLGSKISCKYIHNIYTKKILC